MDFSFQTHELRSICEDEKLSEEAYGTPVSNALKKRLSDLRACTYLNEMPTGNLRSADGINSSELVIDLAGGYILRFCPVKFNNHRVDSNTVNLNEIYRIKLLEIKKSNV